MFLSCQQLSVYYYYHKKEIHSTQNINLIVSFLYLTVSSKEKNLFYIFNFHFNLFLYDSA